MSAARRWALALALAALTGSGAARADQAPERSTRSTPFVWIEVDGDASALARARAVASELFARLGVASIVTSVGAAASKPAGRDALARAYFDLRTPATPAIVVVDGGTEREIIRRVLPDSPSLETSVEGLSHVFYSVVESMLAQPPAEAAPSAVTTTPPADEISSSRPPPPSPIPPPAAREEEAPPSQAPTRPGLDAGAFFRLLAVDSSRLLAGGGLSFRARSRRTGVAFGATVMGAMQAASEISYDGGMASVRPYSLRFYPTVTLPATPGIAVDLGLGAGFDWFDVQQTRTPAGASAGNASALDITLGSLLGARIDLGPSVTLDAAFALDLDLTPRHFVVESGTGRETLLELSRFRPAVLLGASYGFTSSSSSAPSGASP